MGKVDLGVGFLGACQGETTMASDNHGSAPNKGGLAADNVYSDANNPEVAGDRDETSRPWAFAGYTRRVVLCDICGGEPVDGAGSRLFRLRRDGNETVRCGQFGCDPNECARQGREPAAEVAGHTCELATGHSADPSGVLPDGDSSRGAPSDGATKAAASGGDVGDGRVEATSVAVGYLSNLSTAWHASADRDFELAPVENDEALSVMPNGSLNPHHGGQGRSVVDDSDLAPTLDDEPDYMAVQAACRRVERLGREALAFANLLADRPDSPIPWRSHLRTALARMDSAVTSARQVVACELPLYDGGAK